MTPPEMTVNALTDPFMANRPHCGACSKHAVDHPVHESTILPIPYLMISMSVFVI